jgi:uncharacterized membrane protein YkvA (DUF1232 family)
VTCNGKVWRRRFVTAALMAAVLALQWEGAEARPVCLEGRGCQLAAAGLMELASAGAPPSMDRDMQRTMTRAERSMTRFGYVFFYVGWLWLWLTANVVLFLLLAALASLADLRMFGLAREGAGELAHYVFGGMRTFVGLLRDRRTPSTARAVLVVGLLYWLLPFDLVAEGFLPFEEDGLALWTLIDDAIICVVSAKVFMYLCPDALVAQHAAAVENRQQAHA